MVLRGRELNFEAMGAMGGASEIPLHFLDVFELHFDAQVDSKTTSKINLNIIYFLMGFRV